MSKMVNCKACGKELAKGVKKCVHCGKDQRNFFMKHKVLTGVLAVLIIGGAGSAAGNNTDDSSTKTSSETKVANSQEVKKEDAKKEEVKEVVAVSAVDLAKAYEENEVNADKNYKGKTASIEGEVSDIGVAFNQTYITLSAGKDFAIIETQCFFDDKAEVDKVANLKKGDKVTVQGVIDGKSINVSAKKSKLK